MTIQAKLVFDLVGPRAIAHFTEQCRHPMVRQGELLRRLISENADTVFGRRHDFASIESFSGFQARVPITEYEDIEPLVEAARRGETLQLTREKPVFYAMTSGTTGASKYIPVTESSRRAKSRLMRTWLAGLFRDHPRILDGAILQIASPEIEDYAPDGTPCGTEAGHAYRNMPRVMRGLYPVPYEVCEIHDYEARYYSVLRIAIMHPIRVIGTPNPSTILMLARQLGESTERLVRDVRNGTLDAALDIPPEIRECLEEGLEPDPGRAATLEHAATRAGGALRPRDVWPEMQVLATWKGGSVCQYLDQIAPYFPDELPVRDLGWLSSECRGSVPLTDDGDSGPLAIDTNIYEFFPAGSDEEPRPTDLLTVDQIEAGGRYYVYITTPGGLFRYAMHDILEVTGFHERTPSVRFVQKGKGIVSFTGEKLTESQVLAAVEDTIGYRDSNRTFIAAVGRAKEPAYTFLVEYGAPPHEEDARATARELDAALVRHNSEYAAKRESGRLRPVVLRALQAGQFDEFQREALRGRGRDGQFKILRITDDEGFADNFGRVIGDYRAE